MLGVTRSVLYYKPKINEETVWLLNVIRDIWLAHPFYGYRKITVILRRDYRAEVNSKKVLRLMQWAGIQALYPKRKLSQRNPEHRVYPYLLEGMLINRVNQVWMVDITYLKLSSRFVYLVALIDVYSRYVVGWHLSFELDTDNCLEALRCALKHGTAEIVNRDQGCQFTSEDWINALKKAFIKISMDAKGRCIDNIYIERFWRSIKYEAIYLNEYSDFQALYIGVKNYINFYNRERPHQALTYKTPLEVYEMTFKVDEGKKVITEEEKC